MSRRKATYTVEVRHGSLALRILDLPLLPGMTSPRVTAAGPTGPLEVGVRAAGRRLVVTLDRDLLLDVGQALNLVAR